jgi:hypothetical protein
MACWSRKGWPWRVDMQKVASQLCCKSHTASGAFHGRNYNDQGGGHQ